VFYSGEIPSSEKDDDLTSTVTGAGSIADPTLVMISSLGVVATIVLLALLTIKELATASGDPRFQLLGRHPHVATIPLLLVFCLTAIADIL
jgi:hypothetical protein